MYSLLREKALGFITLNGLFKPLWFVQLDNFSQMHGARINWLFPQPWFCHPLFCQPDSFTKPVKEPRWINTWGQGPYKWGQGVCTAWTGRLKFLKTKNEGTPENSDWVRLDQVQDLTQVSGGRSKCKGGFSRFGLSESKIVLPLSRASKIPQ